MRGLDAPCCLQEKIASELKAESGSIEHRGIFEKPGKFPVSRPIVDNIGSTIVSPEASREPYIQAPQRVGSQICFDGPLFFLLRGARISR